MRSKFKCQIYSFRASLPTPKMNKLELVVVEPGSVVNTPCVSCLKEGGEFANIIVYGVGGHYFCGVVYEARGGVQSLGRKLEEVRVEK